MHERFAERGNTKRKGGYLPFLEKKLLNLPEGKSAGGLSVKQVNKPKQLIEAAGQETASRDWFWHQKLKSWDNVITFGEIGTFTQSLYHTN